MDLFLDMLRECRSRLSRGRSGIARLLKLRKQPDFDDRDEIPNALLKHYRTLLDSGVVVWGALAQANSGIFEPGSTDLSGITVYSPDPYFDSRPQDLADIGQAVFALKNTAPTEPDLGPVAARVTSEFDTTVRQPLPGRLTDDRAVFLALSLFHRSRLPGGVLSAPILPLVIAPQETEANMVLPLPYWSDLLRTRWQRIDQMLAELPVSSTARRVALSAPKLPLDGEARPGDDSMPVAVTNAAARAFRAALKQHGVTDAAYLCVGFQTGDPRQKKYAAIGYEFDPVHEACFEAGGINVVVRLDQLDRIRGAVVDYQEVLFGPGFVIMLPSNE